MASQENGSLLGQLSVRLKINLTVAFIFVFVISMVTGYTVYVEKQRAQEDAEERAKDLATFYFDSLNTMMLTSTMGQRNILRNKILKRNNVVDARVIRGEPVNQQYGPGLPEEQPVDDWDRRALQGEQIIEYQRGEEFNRNLDGRVVTVLTPFRATSGKNEGDVNCLACHNVPENSVNGAVRVSYSLKNMDETIAEDLRMQVFANIVLLLVGLILANLLLGKWLSKPLMKLMETVTKRAHGDTAARVQLTSQDEIGRLGSAFNMMADNVDTATKEQMMQAQREHDAAEALKQKVEILLDVVSRAGEGDLTGVVSFQGDDSIGSLGSGLQSMIDNLRQLMEERRAAMEDLEKKVDVMQNVVQRAAAGDLTGVIDIDGDDAVGRLAQGIQSMLNSLNKLVSQVQQSGIQVTSSSTEIAASAKQQEATVGEQAVTVNEIVATATEISATGKELVNTMDEVAGVASGTAEAAASGHTGLVSMESTMHSVVDASKAIASKLEVLSEKAGNINSVVTTITKVADQTNLLSLNAAIEAEKAGEYGVGFAVVATEIRRLADQTAVATLDIEQMVQEMQSAVSAGVMSVEKFSNEVKNSVEDVRQVGAQLAQIIDQVQTLTPRFEIVHEGMQMQSEGAEQIKHAMIQLSESSQQTVESLRQSNSAIDRLNDAAHGLQGGVSQFKIDV